MVMPSLTSTNMHRMTRQLQDRSGGMTAPWRNLPRRSKPDDAFVLITLGGGCRMEYWSGTRPTVMSEKCEITSTECFEAAL